MIQRGASASITQSSVSKSANPEHRHVSKSHFKNTRALLLLKAHVPNLTFQAKLTSACLGANPNSFQQHLKILSTLFFSFFINFSNFFFSRELRREGYRLLKRNLKKLGDKDSHRAGDGTFRNYRFKTTADLQSSLRMRLLWTEMLSLDIKTVFLKKLNNYTKELF